MDESAGRGQRTKLPSAKVKELVGKKSDINTENRVLPPVYVVALDANPRAHLPPAEIEKALHHTKTSPSGERTDFYTLGTHLESKDKHFYIRARRDPKTLYFHAAEAPPNYARLSDENHLQCGADRVESCYTRDMLGKTGDFGQYSTKANVFAREGQFFYEAKIISMNPDKKEDPTIPLIETQGRRKTDTGRGTVRVGFSRREFHCHTAVGGDAYSYGVASYNNQYGSGRFNSQMFPIQGKELTSVKEGDVLGLMITLPTLEVHQKVVEGTFSPAEYPNLKCGPATLKSKKGAPNKKASKPAAKKGKDRDEDDTQKKDIRTTLREQLNAVHGINALPGLDILRDRNPMPYKGLTYFECPDYTTHADLLRPSTRGKSQNQETGKAWDVMTEAHPNCPVPHLRTLPGSKIEIWVNGDYHGIVYEHLLAFLPPASSIEKSTKAPNLWGYVDDGLLGYYPTVTHYGGGAVMCKFDGPFWYGFDKEKYPDARPFGDRYNEQIVEDVVSDLVDEVYMEISRGDEQWMKKSVEALRPIIPAIGPILAPALAPSPAPVLAPSPSPTSTGTNIMY